MGSILGATCEEVCALPLPPSVTEVAPGGFMLGVLAVGTVQGVLPIAYGNRKE